MTEPRMVISLLADGVVSDRLLASVHRLLPAPHAARIALLRPPSARLAAAVTGAVGDGAVFVIDGPDALRTAEIASTPTARWWVWCRDDDEVARCGNGVTVLRADDVESLAWEVVRRLAGDGGDVTTTAAPAPTASTTAMDAVAPDAVAHTFVDGSSAADHGQSVELSGRQLRPPSWAVAPATQSAAPDSAPRVTDVPRRLTPPPWAMGGGQTLDPPPRAAAAPRAVPAPVEPWPVVTAPNPAPPTVLPDDLPSPLASLATSLPRPASDELPPAPAPAADADHSPRPRPDPRRHSTDPTSARSWLTDLRRLALPRRARGIAPSASLAALGQELVRCHSTVVLVGTSKGGPGKTTQAAAISMLGAQAVEPHGGSAVCIDSNLNNPDAWKRLGVPPHAPTVRDLVDALNRGAVPPQGETARDARLRVFPETRGGGSSYSAAEIDRLAQHLRLRHTLVVVDLPNVLPSLLHGPTEAVMAHWLRHADVFVLPIDLGAASFVAAGEVLDALDEFAEASAPRVHMPGVVVPLLVPRGGEKLVRSPEVAELLDHLREAGAAVVEVPQVVEVQAADHFKRPVIGVSPRADAAFARVVDAVVAAAVARRDGAAGRGMHA